MKQQGTHEYIPGPLDWRWLSQGRPPLYLRGQECSRCEAPCSIRARCYALRRRIDGGGVLCSVSSTEMIRRSSGKIMLQQRGVGKVV